MAYSRYYKRRRYSRSGRYRRRYSRFGRRRFGRRRHVTPFPQRMNEIVNFRGHFSRKNRPQKFQKKGGEIALFQKPFRAKGSKFLKKDSRINPWLVSGLGLGAAGLYGAGRYGLNVLREELNRPPIVNFNYPRYMDQDFIDLEAGGIAALDNAIDSNRHWYTATNWGIPVPEWQQQSWNQLRNELTSPDPYVQMVAQRAFNGMSEASIRSFEQAAWNNIMDQQAGVDPSAIKIDL